MLYLYYPWAMCGMMYHSQIVLVALGLVTFMWCELDVCGIVYRPNMVLLNIYFVALGLGTLGTVI